MGINLNIYVHKKDLFNLLEDPADFTFLLGQSLMRYYQFEELFDLSDWESSNEITSQDLLTHLARLSSKIPDRETWVDILSNYDLIFLPDYKKLPDKKADKYFEIYNIYSALVSYGQENIQEVFNKYYEFEGILDESKIKEDNK